jgi:lipopolysaccharide/colanic/teichoic acid biosynthesis glycosyltransferase/dTDP-4-dehydrorhamnose reductase
MTAIKASHRIVVTGASGFVGQQLVADLVREGCEVLAVGRNPVAVQSLLGPKVATCDYDALAERAKDFDALMHLAVINNTSDASIEDMSAVNVTLLMQVAQAAQSAGIGTFFNASSLRADPSSKEAYDRTKAEGESRLRAANLGFRLHTLRLASVYSDEFRGKLSVVGQMPAVLRKPALHVLSCLKPITHVSLIAKTVLKVLTVEGPDDEGPQEVIFVTDAQFGNPVYMFVMRTVDLLCALIIAVGFSWLLFLVWVAIKASSPGPGILAQPRVGKGGRIFTCYKFRTMHQGTTRRATHEVNESAVTRIGRLLRRTKIDELPQVVNIFKNELSLVGPRPCLAEQEALVAARKRHKVLDVKGGITGLAQVAGVDMRDAERLARIDAEYIARRTVLLDLTLILRTAIGGGRGDNVQNTVK